MYKALSSFSPSVQVSVTAGCDGSKYTCAGGLALYLADEWVSHFFNSLEVESLTKVFTERTDVLKMTGATGNRRFAFCNGWH